MADAVRCDFCGGHALRPPSDYYVPQFVPPLPGGWVRVHVAGPPPVAASHWSGEFCDWHCASAALRREANARMEPERA